MTILQTILDTLAGIVLSFLIFWGSIFSGLGFHPPASAPLPTEQTATTTQASPVAPAKSTKGTTTKTAAKPITTRVPPPTQTTPAPVPVVAPTKTQEQINTDTRAALVNILCIPQASLNGISGSGVVIDSRGVILTNAHVAQYFLLRDYPTAGNINCTVRVGSPAQAMYTATLLYIPPAWVAANASQLKAAQAMGTGEDDYAFLLITGRTDSTVALPDSFARVEMDRASVDTGEPMLLAAYPAGFLGNEDVQKSLYISSAIAYVTQLFSFNDNKTVDLFSIGGTVVSQGGSSGGAAVRLQNGTLAGIIATATVGASTGERDLRAVSLSFIDNSLISSGHGGIATLLSGNLVAKAAIFNTQVAPSLTAELEAVLESN